MKAVSKAAKSADWGLMTAGPTAANLVESTAENLVENLADLAVNSAAWKAANSVASTVAI